MYKNINIKDIAIDAESAYELVMQLKKMKNDGVKYISNGVKLIPIGKLMKDIVTWSKEGKKLDQILFNIHAY